MSAGCRLYRCFAAQAGGRLLRGSPTVSHISVAVPVKPRHAGLAESLGASSALAAAKAQGGLDQVGKRLGPSALAQRHMRARWKAPRNTGLSRQGNRTHSSAQASDQRYSDWGLGWKNLCRSPGLEFGRGGSLDIRANLTVPATAKTKSPGGFSRAGPRGQPRRAPQA